MASSSGSWTLAGGKKNKHQNSQSMSKTKKKAVIENMPRIEPNPPVQESPTIYSVFLQSESEKERKSEMVEQQQPAVRNSSSASSIMSGHSKKKTLEKKKDQQYMLEDALQQITVAELEAILMKDKQTFPDNPEVWLKDLASLMNLRLDDVPAAANDAVFEGKSPDYPLSVMSKSLRVFLTDSMSQHSTDTLKLFLDHCVSTVMNDAAKGLPTYGYQVYIQLLLRTKPNIAVSNLSHYVSMLKSNIGRPQSALCVLWTVAQAGYTSLPAGLTVWLEVMLPVLNIHGLSAFCVHFIETLLRCYPDVCDTEGAVLPKREFFMLFDELFSSQTKLSASLHTRLLHVYPRLKAITFGRHPESILHNYFTSFLSRLTHGCHGSKKTELLACLVSCLIIDRQSLSTWRQVYSRHLPQSSVLLSHVADDMASMTCHVDRQLLRDTVQVFAVTNDKLTCTAMSSAQDKADVQLAANSCQLILDDLRQARVSSQWFVMLMLILVLLVSAALAADVYASTTGITGCYTYRALDSVGVMQFVHHVYSRLSLYAGLIYSWLVETCPVYYGKAVDIVEPYGSVVVVNLRHVVSAAQPLVDLCHIYISDTVTVVCASVPMLLSTLADYISSVGDVIVLLYVHSAFYADVINSWLLTNVLVGSLSPMNIHELVTSISVQLQTFTVRLYHWLLELAVYV